jgi:hypothetical protein
MTWTPRENGRMVDIVEAVHGKTKWQEKAEKGISKLIKN